ncbi:hypothetical protein [Rhizobium leguminosarum]
MRFFGRLADSTNLAAAMQNAPAFLGRRLTAADLASLRQRRSAKRELSADEYYKAPKPVVAEAARRAAEWIRMIDQAQQPDPSSLGVDHRLSIGAS